MSKHTFSILRAYSLPYICSIAMTIALSVALLREQGPFLKRMRIFSKRVINPLVLRVAGSTYSPFAVIHHVGRRSGRSYETPLLLAPVADGFVIELTYGFAVDWLRNVQAAGQCVIKWHGREYHCTTCDALDAARGLRAFPLILRLPLRIFGAQHFVHMQCQ